MGRGRVKGVFDTVKNRSKPIGARKKSDKSKIKQFGDRKNKLIREKVKGTVNCDGEKVLELDSDLDQMTKPEVGGRENVRNLPQYI